MCCTLSLSPHEKTGRAYDCDENRDERGLTHQRCVNRKRAQFKRIVVQCLDSNYIHVCLFLFSVSLCFYSSDECVFVSLRQHYSAKQRKHIYIN